VQFDATEGHKSRRPRSPPGLRGGTCNWSPTSPPNGVRYVEAGRVESYRQVLRHRSDLPVLWRLGRLLVEPAFELSGTLAPPHRARVALLAE
jgi:hypothetical protein